MTKQDKLPLPEITPYTGTLADNVARIALDIGEGMLKSDAEVHRVEIAVEKICRAYCAEHIDVFTIQSLILVAVHMPDGTHSTQSRRIFTNTTHLARIEEYNALSRRICEEKLTIEEVDSEIRRIKNTRTYPFWLTMLGNMLGAGSFAVLFGGSLLDALASAVIAVAVAALNAIELENFNKMIKTLLISLVSGLLSCLSVRIGFGDNLDMILVGVLMLMIPGLSLGNAMRDLLWGDTLTGASKAIQAVIVAVMIAVGYGVSLLIAGGGL